MFMVGHIFERSVGNLKPTIIFIWSNFLGGGGMDVFWNDPISNHEIVHVIAKNFNPVNRAEFIPCRGGAKTILFGGCKTTFCRQKGVASARLGRCQSEPYSFLSDVQRLTPSSRIIYFNLFLK